MPRRLAPLSACLFVAACGTPSTAPSAPRASASTSARTRPVGAPPRPPSVRVALLRTDGSAFGPNQRFTPDPVATVNRCLDETGRATFLEGYALFDVTLGGSTKLSLRRSADLSEALLLCIAKGLEASQVGPVIDDTGQGIAYVSIGAE
ncbi:MAG: hypothetical protein U0414_09905 [Polyangiaceae bacterium]